MKGDVAISYSSMRLLRHFVTRKDREKVTHNNRRGECLAMAKERVINYHLIAVTKGLIDLGMLSSIR